MSLYSVKVSLKLRAGVAQRPIFASNKSIHLRWTVSPSLDVKAAGFDKATELDLGKRFVKGGLD